MNSTACTSHGEGVRLIFYQETVIFRLESASLTIATCNVIKGPSPDGMGQNNQNNIHNHNHEGWSDSSNYGHLLLERCMFETKNNVV